MKAESSRDRIRQLDSRLLAAGKEVRVLSELSWPQRAAEEFLANYERGQPALPASIEPRPPAAAVVEALRSIEAECDPGHPVERFIGESARSYGLIAELIRASGTPAAHACSRQVYGAPDMPIPGTGIDHLEAARILLEATEKLTAATRTDEAEYCILPDAVVSKMQARIDQYFGPGRIVVALDATLSAKAAASAHRVRLRDSTCFSEQDVEQLIEHEVFVHSLTALNGRAQPELQTLSLGTPRTTATQEGLATFAELVTDSIDLHRLRRLALRVEAIHRAEEGANFIELFEHLVGLGESPAEAVRTAMRVFRGGDVRGRHVFTKDVVYLSGLVSVFTFFRKSIADRRPELIPRLFCGRLTLADAVRLDAAFDAGTIRPAQYLPRWSRNIRSLAAFLSFSTLVHRVDLDDVSLEDLGEPPRG